MHKCFHVSNRAEVALIALVLGHAAFAQNESTFPSKADQYVSSVANQRKFRGAVLVALKGKMLFTKSYGNAVEAWNVPNTIETKFELASLTKQFTGAAILQLAQAGKLQLENRVSVYYPQAPDSWRDITVDELVRHTSGLPNNEINDFSKGICAPYTREELIATFRSRPLAFKPGTHWAYTNTEYYLLAYIIERLSGQSYEEYLTKNIFQPLGMNDSGFASTLSLVPRMAEGYARDGERLRHRDYFDRSLEIGAGGVYSTVTDMMRWSAALDSEILLKRPWVDVMFKPSSAGAYGYGWFVETKPRLKEYHEGSDPGFAAFEIRYPDEGAFIIVFSNLEDAPVRDIANGLGGLLLDGKFPENAK